MPKLPVFKVTSLGQVFLDDMEIPCVESAFLRLTGGECSQVDLTITVSDVIVNYPQLGKDEK